MRFAVAATVGLAVLAAIGYIVWDRKFSPAARVEAAYQTCLAQLVGKADGPRAPGTPSTSTVTPPSSGLGDAVASLRDRVGGAVCGAIRDACTQDFHGSICQAALRRSGA
jgi:hypothetical protein